MTEETAQKEPGLFADALGYPLRFGGWAMIVTGAVLSVILNFTSGIPVVGLPVAIFSAGFFASFYLDIVSTTIAGDDGMPDWPSVTDFSDDILMPFLRVIGVTLLSFAPAIAVFFLMEEKTAAFPWAFGAAIVWGCFYFPMALLGSVVCGNLYGALPHIVAPGVLRAMPGYLLAAPGLVVAMAACGTAEDYSQRLPFVGWLVAAAIALYSLMVQARVIGLIYREKREALGWE
jgi:hypothetical protein